MLCELVRRLKEGKIIAAGVARRQGSRYYIGDQEIPSYLGEAHFVFGRRVSNKFTFDDESFLDHEKRELSKRYTVRKLTNLSPRIYEVRAKNLLSQKSSESIVTQP